MRACYHSIEHHAQPPNRLTGWTTKSTDSFPAAYNTFPHPPDPAVKQRNKGSYLRKAKATMEGTTMEETRSALSSILPPNLPPHVNSALNCIVNTSNALARRMGTFNDPSATSYIRRELLDVAEEAGVQVCVPFGILRARQETMIKPFLPAIQEYFKEHHGFDFVLTVELLDNVLTAKTLRTQYLDKETYTSGDDTTPVGDDAAQVEADTAPLEAENIVADPVLAVPHVQPTCTFKVPYVAPNALLGTPKPHPTRRIVFEGMGRGTGGFVLDPYDNFDLFVELVGGSPKGMQYTKDHAKWLPLDTREQYVAMWLGAEIGTTRFYLQRKRTKKVYPDVTIEKVIDEAMWASDEAMFF